MKTPLFIPFFAAAALLTAVSVRADLGHAWDSGSGLPAAVDTVPADSSDSIDSADNTDGSAPPSLDAQIADLLDDDTLVSSSSSALDLSAVTVPLSEEELLLDRLAAASAAEAEASAPSSPEASAPVGSSDTSFATGTDRIASRVSSTMAVQGVSPADATPICNFTASDIAANYTENWYPGDNGGRGFAGWEVIGNAPSRGLDGDGFAASGVGSAGSGEAGMGRAFAGGIALESGTFSVDARHGYSDRFSGFAVYGDGGTELFRWGVTSGEDAGGQYATGFWYSIDQGAYNLVAAASSETLRSRIDYSLTWTLLEGNLDINLSILSHATGDPLADPLRLTLDNSSAVTAIGILVAGGTSSDDSDLHFDNLKVTDRAVPEPATLALILLGALALHPFRRR